jgi:hypothetical protein
MRRNTLVGSLLAATLSGGLACSGNVHESAPGAGGGNVGGGDASGASSGGTAGTGGTAGEAGKSVSASEAGEGGSAGERSGEAGSSAGAGTSGGSSGAGGAAGGGGSSALTCNPSCGAHQTCGVQGSTPTCNCVAGYELTQAGSCVWGTVPADPGFQNIPAGAWTLGQGATIDPTAAGYIDPGHVTLSHAASCAPGAGVHQSITMPTLAQSQPLALTLVANVDCITKQAPDSCWAMDVDAVVNGGTLSSYVEVAPYVSHLGCLGERAYGGTFDLVIRPRSGQACSALYTDAIVDHVQIAPWSTCPLPGTIPDADFDGATDTWKTWTGGAEGLLRPVAEIAPSLGSAGSAAALISPPLSFPNLALQVRFKGTAGTSARVVVDTVPLAVLTGTGTEVSSNVCLLESNKGMAQDLLLGIGLGVANSPPSDFTPCGAANQDFVFDDLKFVSDPSCPATSYVADGGFERTDPASAWDRGLQSGGVLVAATGDTVGIDTTAANVHGGQRALKMVNSDGCGVRSAAFPATIPASVNGAGPALQFFYKAPALTKSKLNVTANLATSGNLPAATNYTQAQICLDPTMSGQTVTVLLTLAGNAQGLCAAQPTETAWFDDFAVTTSASCPSE